jgi:hypothetical protein
LLFNVSTKLAAVTAATSVLNEPAATAVSTISAIKNSTSYSNNRSSLELYLKTCDCEVAATLLSVRDGKVITESNEVELVAVADGCSSNR